MTAVAGLRGPDGGILLGADSLSSSNEIATVSVAPKAFALLVSRGLSTPSARLLIGCAGHIRLAQAIEHAFQPPEDTRGESPPAYCVRFAEALRGFASERDLLVTKDGEKLIDGRLLVGWGGRLFTICADLAVVESVDPYAVIGCGESLARGAIHALLAAGVTDPSVILSRALEAAAYFDPHVRGPFHFVFEPAPRGETQRVGTTTGAPDPNGE